MFRLHSSQTCLRVKLYCSALRRWEVWLTPITHMPHPSVFRQGALCISLASFKVLHFGSVSVRYGKKLYQLFTQRQDAVAQDARMPQFRALYQNGWSDRGVGTAQIEQRVGIME